MARRRIIREFARRDANGCSGGVRWAGPLSREILRSSTGLSPETVRVCPPLHTPPPTCNTPSSGFPTLHFLRMAYRMGPLARAALESQPKFRRASKTDRAGPAEREMTIVAVVEDVRQWPSMGGGLDSDFEGTRFT